ncbi:MAG TPA: ZIP family metal transporter [Elusimicrobiota bacterium]|jgi:ZIP family zinc transporter|nr:ZIP family metal transporter [Elusimicrobiota bacterium]
MPFSPSAGAPLLLAPLALAVASSTLIGGWFALRFREKLPLVMGFTAGVLIGLVSFDLLPEIIGQLQAEGTSARAAMAALVAGFLLFHSVEKVIMIRHGGECSHGGHRHPQVGTLSALALSGHSFMDGVSIGLAFQVSRAIGLVVALAVVAHDFADGMNTVVVLLAGGNGARRTLPYLLLNSLVPALGMACALFFHPSPRWLLLCLGFFSGFLLYIGASHILPEAHREESSPWTLLLTFVGAFFAFGVSVFA